MGEQSVNWGTWAASENERRRHERGERARQGILRCINETKGVSSDYTGESWIERREIETRETKAGRGASDRDDCSDV